MQLNDFCKELKLSDTFAENIEPFWSEFCQNVSDELPFFFETDFFKKYYSLSGRNDTDKVFPVMQEVADIARKNPALARYANMMHYELYARDKRMENVTWETLENVLGKNEGVFSLLVALSSLPLVRKKHIELGLDENFMHGTAEWIGAFAGIYAVAHDGMIGHPMSNLYWLRLSITGELFRIGRLEFLPGKWSEDMPYIYRRRSDGEIAVLCCNGWTFDKNLMRVEPDSPEAVFKTEFIVENNTVTGIPVNPAGYPEKDKKISLDLTEWECFLQEGSECMTLHIPGGGNMSLEAVRKSLADAKTFYKKMFDKDIKAFCCASWIFNPVWQKELPESNMSKWQKASYMTPPLIANGVSGLFFVYGEPECDPRQRKCETSLHRAFCRIFDRGEKLRSGMMFMLPEDV